MPAFKGRIPDAEIWKIVAYVRSMSGLTRQDARSSRADEMQTTPAQSLTKPATPSQKGSPPGDGFGVVEMGSEPEAAAAIRTLDGFEIRGRPLTVRWATPPERTACGHPKMFGTMNMK